MGHCNDHIRPQISVNFHSDGSSLCRTAIVAKRWKKVGQSRLHAYVRLHDYLAPLPPAPPLLAPPLPPLLLHPVVHLPAALDPALAVLRLRFLRPLLLLLAPLVLQQLNLQLPSTVGYNRTIR